MSRSVSRRQFLRTSSLAAASAAIAPCFVHASDKAGKQTPVVGTGDFQFECHHQWGEVPDGWQWGNAHGVTFDKAGNLYVTHQLNTKEKQDAVIVFDADGAFVRSFGKQFHGGGHGLDIREDDGTEYLYLCDMKNSVTAKLTLDGEEVWRIDVPRESGKYENKQRYVPTNVAFAPDGGFFIADGYGSNWIHRFDADAKYVSTFGGTGTGEGQFKTPHGLIWDDRPGRTPALVVTDRANARIQYFDESGKFLSAQGGVSLPCDFDLHKQAMVVSDLQAIVAILDGENKIVARLGADPAWEKAVMANKRALRGQPDKWRPGRFIHPHDTCWDRQGNLIVAEWTNPGRLSFLRRV